MITEPMTPQELLPGCEPGSCLYGEGVASDDGHWVVCYFMRETSDAIDDIPDSPQVLFRQGVFCVGEVRPVVVILGVLHPDGISLYEAWFNFNQEHKELLELLIEQTRTLLHFIGDSGDVERCVQFDVSGFRAFWEAVQSEVCWQDWTDDEFFAAKDRLSRRYSTEELWEYMGNARGNS
jgi:hypothetical protein